MEPSQVTKFQNSKSDQKHKKINIDKYKVKEINGEFMGVHGRLFAL